MSNRGKLLAGVSVGALVAAPEAALAMGGPKWGAHVELGGKFSEDRQIGSADFFMPLWQDQFSLLFADVRGRFDNNESLEGNFGLGYRRQVNKDWIVGGYAFYDIKESEFDNKFNQLTAGFEAMSEDWEFRINGYLPEDDVKPVSGAGGGGGTSSVRITGTTIQLVTPGIGSAEQAFYGGDVEVGFKVPLFDHNDDGKELRVFAGGFHFDSDMAAKEIAGPRGRAELRMFDVLGTGSRFVLGGEVQRDDIRGTEAYGTVQIRVPLQSTKAKRLTGLDRRMLNTVQRDVDIVTNLIPGVDEIIEDVIIDFQGVGTDTIVFADKYGNPGGPGTVNDPTTLGQAQYALGKDADNNRIFPGIIVINDDDDGALSGTNGIQLRPNQALIGGGLPVVLTGAETGRQVAHAFGGDTNENGTLLLAANEGRFIRLANNNEVGGFSIYGDSYNGKGASHTGIHGGEGVNQAFIRDMNIYNMGTAGISIENFNNEDRNIRIDNLLVDVDKYSNVDNRRNLGRGVSIGFYAGSDVLAADDGIVDIDVSITNSTIFSGGENPGISVDVEANEGSVTTNIAITDNSVTNVGYDTEEEYNGYTYIYSVRDDAIEIDQFLSGGGTARFNTLVANNTIGGGRRGIDIDGYVGPGTELVHNVRVEDNTLYGLKSGVAIGTGVKSFGGYGDSAKQIFGNANYTVKGAPQTQISGTVNVADNIMARPNYGAGPNNIYGAGISVRNSFYGAVVSGTAQAAGQVINITDNNLVGVRGQLVSVQTGVGSHNLQALEHGANQQYQTPRVNDDAISFVNQEITVSDNSNTYVPNKHGAPDGEVSFGGIQVSTNVYGGINKDADSGLGNGLELVDVRQDITVTNNDVENVIAPPDYYGSYQYYGPFNAGNNIPFDIGQIRIIGLPSSGRSVGIQVAGFASESNQPGGEPQQVSLAQSLNVSGNTVNDLRAFPGYYGYGYGQMDVSTGMDDPGTGLGI
ncbi:MAG: inverse autotransporter beta domain-containing protein, partial [Alphaproteobacteria bacterium]